MKDNLDRACYNLGKTIFESGIAEAFGIEPDQKIDFNNEGVLTLIEFILHHADESIVSYAEQMSAYNAKGHTH